MSEEVTNPAPAEEAPAASEAPKEVSLTDNYTGIPQEYQDNPAFEGKKLNDVLDSYLQQQDILKTHEENGLVAIPTEDAEPEKIDQFYKKLGKPETPAEYGFKAPEDWPEGLDYSDERAASFAEFAHQNNLTTSQANNLFGFYHDMVKNAYAEQQEATENKLASNVEQLEQFWGSADSEKFNENKNIALRGFNALVDADFAAQIKEDPVFASDPRMLRLMHAVGMKMQNDTSPSLIQDVTPGRFPDSAASLDNAIKNFHETGKFKAMMNEPHTAAGQEARKEWDALQQKRIELYQ